MTPSPPRILMRESVLRDVVLDCAAARPREAAGFLFGHAAAGEIRIEGHFVPPSLKTTETQFRMTPEAFDETRRELEATWPGTLILGWFVSHPRGGVFLSASEMFVHSQFFRLPDQVVLVVDSAASTLGFFGWIGAQMRPCSFQVADPS